MNRHSQTALSNLVLSLMSTLVFLFIAPEQGICQSQYRLGPLLGYNANVITSGFPYSAKTGILSFPTQTGGGESFGISLQRNVNSAWSLGVEAAYNDLSGSRHGTELHLTKREAELYGYEVQLDPGPRPNEPLTWSGDTLFTALTTISYQTVSLTLSGQWRPPIASSRRFGVDVGIASHLLLKGNSITTLLIDDQPYAYFVNSDHTSEFNQRLLLYDGDIPDAHSIRLGLRGGVFAELGNRDSGIVVTPGLYVEYGLTPAQEGSNWQIHRLGVQMAILFGL